MLQACGGGGDDVVSAGNSYRQSSLVATSLAYKLPASDGLLFNDPGNGNCQACHPTARGADGSFPLFTDFSFNNLGVPRNAAIVRNDEPGYFDLGLCARADLAARAGLCDAFKVRHAAQRGAALCVLPQRALQQPEGRGHVCDAPALRDAEVDDVIAS